MNNANLLFGNKSILCSKSDIKKGVRIPKKINKELSESIGIIIGDGSLGIYKNMRNYRLLISSNFTEDLDYISKYVKPLFKTLFNITGKVQKTVNTKEVRLCFYSKLLVNFYNKIIKLPLGKKKNLTVSKIIKKNKLFMCHFVRGLADTDFSLTFIKQKGYKFNSYPCIHAGFDDEKLVKEVYLILRHLKLEPKIYYSEEKDKRNDNIYTSYHIFLKGKDRLDKWFKIIGFKNPKHVTKYLVWKKFGFCPPHTTLKQRKDILKNRLNPYNLYKRG